MGELYNRSFALTLGDKRIASETIDGAKNLLLNVEFSVERTTKADANTAEISIYNLTESTRSEISKKGIATTLEVGYSGKKSVIFSGGMDYGRTVKSGPDWVTTLQSTDGGSQLRDSRVNVSFKSGLTASGALQAVADTLGVGVGNSVEQLKRGNIKGALRSFGNGLVLSGPSKREFNQQIRAFGFEWSIQDGNLQILEPGQILEPSLIITLSPTTGLVGSPQTGENGLVEARSLLIPALIPGRGVRLESALISGRHRVERVVFSGGTYSDAWYADLELRPV